MSAVANLLRNRNPDGLVAGLALALTGVFVLGALGGWYWVARTPQPVASHPTIPDLAPQEAVASEQVDSLDSITGRPLFWSERRPPEEPEEEVEEVVEEEEPEAPRRRGSDPFDDARLVGVYQSLGMFGAIIRVDGERHRLLPGETLLEWQLVGLDAQGAEFLRDGTVYRGEPTERRLQLEHVFQSQ